MKVALYAMWFFIGSLASAEIIIQGIDPRMLWLISLCADVVCLGVLLPTLMRGGRIS